MRLTSGGRYAVMAFVDLVLNGRDGRPVPLAAIASRTNISLSYLEQLFAKLRRAGLVRSVRGPGGGYMAAREPSAVCIGDVVMAVDRATRRNRCSPGAPDACGDVVRRCESHDMWHALSQHVDSFLNTATVEQVCRGELPAIFPAPAALAAHAAVEPSPANPVP